MCSPWTDRSGQGGAEALTSKLGRKGGAWLQRVREETQAQSMTQCSKWGREAPGLPPGPSSRILEQKKTSETGSVAGIQVTDEDTAAQNE